MPIFLQKLTYARLKNNKRIEINLQNNKKKMCAEGQKRN